MIDERISKMADMVTDELMEPEDQSGFIPSVRIAASSDDDSALANVDQSLDTMLAAIAVIDDNLPKIKTANMPEQATVDIIKDLMETAIKPYLSDVLKAMQVFGK